MTTLRLGVVMDSIGSIKPYKDSTFAMLLEAQARGWQVEYMELADLYLRDGRAAATLRPLTVRDTTADWFELGEPVETRLSELDIVLMRKDPPFDLEYIVATYILERAEAEGTLVVNRPQALRDANEKVFTAWFPQCCPPCLVTRSKRALHDFLTEQEAIVLKPVDYMGGRSIFVVREGDANTNVIFEEMTQREQRYVVAQAFLPAGAETGDKRILLIDGVAHPRGIARMPTADDPRANLAVGATAEGFELTDRDRWICEQLGPVFKKRGLYFVGIDVIDGYLTEINVTSPTGIREIDNIFGDNVAVSFLDALAALSTCT